MNRTWFVDNNGFPKCLTKDPNRRNKMLAAGFVEINALIPNGLHEPKKGKFAKWDFVSSNWITDTVREQDYQDKINRVGQAKQDALSAFQFLKNNKDNPGLTINQLANATFSIIKYIGIRLDV